MAAVSKAQQRFMGMVHAAQKGEEPASADVAKVAKNIGDKDAEDYASTKHKGLPNKVGENITTKNHKPETKGERDFWNFHKSSTYSPDRGYGAELDTIDFDDSDKEPGYQANDKDNEKRGYEPVMKNYDPQTHKIKEVIRQMVREIMTQSTLEEMNTTGNVAGYQTPYAFTSKGGEKKKAKKQADLTGYSVVNEAKELDKETLLKIFNIPKGADRVSVKKERHGYTIKYDDPKTGAQNTSFLSQARIDNYLSGKLKETISENRWLELRNEVTPPHAKIGKGISNINKQLAEMERFLNWYGRIKQESGVTNDQFWKRTNHNIYRIKERLIKLEQQVRKIAQ